MKKVTTLVIIGAVAGAAIWLLSTKKGKQVLSDIKDTSGDLAGKLKSGLDTIKHTTSSAIEKGKHYITSANNKVQETN